VDLVLDLKGKAFWAQVVECLSSKHEALGSNTVLQKKKKKRKEKGRTFSFSPLSLVLVVGLS
jgi:hypothetical protein